MLDLASFFGGMLILGIVLVLGVGMPIDWLSCRGTAHAMRVQYSYGPFQGCVVQFKGTWMPLSAVGAVQVSQ